MPERKALIVGLSGCSSSGKTTLARLLRDIFPETFILHEDDFYKPENELPSKNGVLDWDCAEAIDVSAMAQALSYIRSHAAFPPSLDSKEDRNSIGKCPVSSSTISALKSRVSSSLPSSSSLPKICLFDGFLLYSPSMAPVKPHIDIKLFLRASYALAKKRREARDGYATIEGFWQDPPGYVDMIVWPNYVEEHAWMFEGGDVEGKYKEEVLRNEGIRVPKGQGVDTDMTKMLEWAVDILLEELKAFA
ncbi:AAA domain-containing protein [Sarocladium implicatum]|nr:AAA domain-containing protein [Sarocladium implicatum]